MTPAFLTYVSLRLDDGTQFEGAAHIEEIQAIEPLGRGGSRIYLRHRDSPITAYEPAEVLIKRWIDMILLIDRGDDALRIPEPPKGPVVP